MALPSPSGGDAAFSATNPYVDWAWGPGNPYYFPPGLQDGAEKRMTLLVRIKGMSAEQFVNGSFFIKNKKRREEWEASFVIPFPGLPTASKPGDQRSWVIAFATPAISATLAKAKALQSVVESVVLGRPLNTASLPVKSGSSKPGIAEMVASLAKGGTTSPPTVFMGVIDDGLAFANARFRTLSAGKHRTRVQDWWLMASGAGGQMLDKRAIDALFDLCTDGNGVLQEDLFYRRCGLIDYRDGAHKAAAWRATHGTHVLDAMAGYDPSDNRLDRPIACVQLPNAVTVAVDNGSLIPYIVWATGFILGSMLDYCFRQGIGLLPVVINFSYGRLEGPHDGTADVEVFIENITAICKTLGITLRFVLPSGNSFLSRVHAQTRFTAIGQTRKLQWNVLPDGEAESFVEIWTPRLTGGNSRLTLTVTDPSGASASITELQANKKLGTYGKLSHDTKPAHGVFYILVPPTASLLSGPLAPAGTYQIELKHTGGLSSTDFIDVWVARDDTIPGYPQLGRQSYLDDDLYEYHNPYTGRVVQTDNSSLVQRQCTINAIATSRSPVVIGGFLRRDMVMAEYSAAGARSPRRQPPRWPDAAAPSEDSYVLMGRLAAGSHSGSRVAVGGTSVAAPQIARRVADDLANGGKGDRAAVQALADYDEAHAPPGDAPPPPWTAKPPQERGGHGRIWNKPLQKVKRYEY